MTCVSCLAVKEAAKDDLVDADQGFHGIGVGAHARFGHVIMAYVERGVQVPKEIGGVKVLARYTEPVRSLSMRRYPLVNTLDDPRRYPIVRSLDSFVRPVSGGNSVGAWSQLLGGYVTGTVGMAFQTADGKNLILSNNHVIAGIATVQRGGATIGSQIFQPGSYFGGSSADSFASLYQWGPLDEVNPNTMDWATALVSDPSLVSPQVLNVGTPASVADFAVGMSVAKMGALSGLTRGTVIDTNATVDVNYENLFTASFDDQVVIEGSGGIPFGVPGDSGSTILSTVGGKLVVGGLLFSGSTSITVANKMTLVQQAIGSALPVVTVQALPAQLGSLSAGALALVGAASAFLTRKASI